MTQTTPLYRDTDSHDRRLLIVLNPTAGRRRTKRLDAVLAALKNADCHISLHRTRSAGEAREIAASADTTDVDVIVAAGGDGTIGEVANGLAGNEKPPALGVIPLGTANVFATEIGLDRKPSRIAETLVQAQPFAIYPGRANGHLFLMMASVGFDARVVAGVDLGLKKRLGKSAYVWQGLFELWRRPKAIYQVRVGDDHYSAAAVIAAKGRHYGGAFVVAHEASLARPEFELCLLSGGGRLDVLRQAVGLGLGRFDRLAGLTILRTDAFEIRAPAGEPVQADGDIVTHLPVTIEIAPKPLMVLRPNGVNGAN